VFDLRRISLISISTSSSIFSRREREEMRFKIPLMARAYLSSTFISSPSILAYSYELLISTFFFSIIFSSHGHWMALTRDSYHGLMLGFGIWDCI
jgi:hypothetical protein